jgi:DnaK suppressor protein
MIVSILQLMGFQRALPVHSRAVEVPTDHVQGTPARRHEVKASTGKDNKVKPTKGSSKTAVKTLAKPVAKKAAPQATKPGAKSAVKPVDKTSAKSPTKKTSVPVKASAKVVAKKVQIAAPAKPASKPVAKPSAKNAKPAPKKVTPVATKPAVKVSPKAPTAAPKVNEKKSMSLSSSPAKATPVPVVPVPVAAPAKAGRPSSRLAQLTVPSIAQAVASNAAKSSYSQSAPVPVISPALPASVKKDPKLANNWKTKSAAELTDAELMAMPDSEYMNEVQMAVFRLKLVVLKRDILSNAGETTEHLREDTSVTPDPADRATIEEEHALELRTRDRERKLLKKIEQSIARIDAGDYGYCDETGEPIGVGRLLARPTATLSLEAQQRRELKQKMFGD